MGSYVRILALALALTTACGGKEDAPIAVPMSAGKADSPSNRATLEAAAKWSESEGPVPVTSADPMWGKREAPVTLVVFSDFQCPYCARLAPTFHQIEETYGADKVRIFWKNRPLAFHDAARPAAEAAMAVFLAKGSSAFFRFHDRVFEDQQALRESDSRAVNAAALARWAGEVGVSASELDRYRADAAEKVRADEKLADRLSAYGTPLTFVNGVRLSGAQPYEAFKILIDAELVKSLASIASGTAASDVYTARSRLVI